MPVVTQQCFQSLTAHLELFAMHLVSADCVALYGAEGASAHMQCNFFLLDAMLSKCFKYARREVKTSRGSSHAALYSRIHRLVCR